jgi:dipeptidyl-peptidase-4
MKTFRLLLILAFLTSIHAYSQKRQLTMEDAVLNVRTTLAPKKLHDLKWIGGMDAYSFVDTSGVLQRRNVLRKDYMAPLLLSSLNRRLNKMNADTFLKFPDFKWESKSAISFVSTKKLMIYNIDKDTLAIVADRNYPVYAENTDEDPVTHKTAYTRDNNLYIYFPNANIIAVTKDAEKNIVNGKSVHREEFGITKGTFWSPEGNYLAYYRMDQTMVSDYPIVDFNTKPATVEMIKYPMAGDKSHEVTIGIYDVKAAKTIFLQTGLPADQYLTNIAWSPDEKHVYTAVLNRDQTEMKLNCYNAVTGAFEKTLFTETDAKYVHPTHAMEFVKSHPGEFVWQSRRDGYNHLYLYNTDGTLVRQLTKGSWEVTAFGGFDANGMRVFFTCNASSPVNRDFYSSDLATGNMLMVSGGNGTHKDTISESGNYVLDMFSDPSTPNVISLYSSKGKKVNELFRSPDPLQDFALGDTKIFTVKSRDGSDLYCRMYLPVGFDSTKKYPLILYVYGGPNIQLIQNKWMLGSGDLWAQYMAERGFIVFSMDNRGTANRGKDFEQVIFRMLGKAELDDQQQGINYLLNLKYVDQTRMGIYGWSYGGFMTTSMMTRFPGIFSAGVAGGPVIDWSYYEVMYTERYMDTPQNNIEGYNYTNVLRYVDQLQGKLLVIHGTSDPAVVWQQSLLFIKKCIDSGKQVDYFVYPGHEHNVLGKDRVHLLNKIADYFITNLN